MTSAMCRPSRVPTALLLSAGLLMGPGLVLWPLPVTVLVLLLALAAVPTLRTGWLLTGLLASTFATRFSWVVGGLALRPEHLLVVALLVFTAGRRGVASLIDAAVRPPLLWLGAFVTWNAAVSMFQAPEPGQSLPIVGWLAADWLLVLALTALAPDPDWLLGRGLRIAAVASLVAIGLWVLGTAHLTTFGTQFEPDSGSLAAYGVAYESNVLASVMALWVFIGASKTRLPGEGGRAGAVAAGMAAIMLSLTRAAFVAVVAGMGLWQLSARRANRRFVFTVLLAVVATVGTGMRLSPALDGALRAQAGGMLDFSEGTGKLRLESWRTAVGDLDGAAWLVGLGTNSFGQRHLEPTRPDTPTPAYLANMPLQVLYDSGAVGAGLLFAAYLSVLPCRARERSKAVGLTVVFVVATLATSTLWFASTWLLFAVASIRKATVPTDPTTVLTRQPRENDIHVLP